MARKYHLQMYRHTVSPQQGPEWVDIDKLEIHPFLLEALAELGFIEIKDKKLRQKQVSRINKIQRLRQSLGVNLPGACIIIDLLDRMEELENEIELLRRR